MTITSEQCFFQSVSRDPNGLSNFPSVTHNTVEPHCTTTAKIH